jgi:23S rRNA (uracil1939-C5)-methyltransferase
LLESSGGTLVDAYCGAGFFAKRLRPRFDKVVGIDWDRHAIAVAQENAAPNEQYIAGDVEEQLAARLENVGALIVDPPATGLGGGVRDLIIQHRPPCLIYVSCNPSTLARDLAALKQSYAIDSITPIDMFPQTAEIEAVASLRSLAQA